jgi:hypothetical protein
VRVVAGAISDTLLGRNYLEALTFKVSKQSGVQPGQSSARDTKRGQEQQSDHFICRDEFVKQIIMHLHASASQGCWVLWTASNRHIQFEPSHLQPKFVRNVILIIFSSCNKFRVYFYLEYL